MVILWEITATVGYCINVHAGPNEYISYMPLGFHEIPKWIYTTLFQVKRTWGHFTVVTWECKCWQVLNNSTGLNFSFSASSETYTPPYKFCFSSVLSYEELYVFLKFWHKKDSSSICKLFKRLIKICLESGKKNPFPRKPGFPFIISCLTLSTIYRYCRSGCKMPYYYAWRLICKYFVRIAVLTSSFLKSFIPAMLPSSF